MDEIILKLDEKGKGGFYFLQDKEQVGEMEISITGTTLIVYHTEVAPKAEGKGLAKKLLEEMTGYARKNGLTVVPYCPFVHAQFKRHPEQYADIWNGE